MSEDRAYWERHAKRYDRSTRFLAKPVPRMLELVVGAVRDKARVLEVAAGTGLLTKAVAPVVGELVATDYAAAMVAQLEAHAPANARCEQADLYDLRFAPASFDAVLAANVLHLVPDLAGALASLRRVLVRGGVLVAPTYLHAETVRASLLSRVLALTGFPGQRRFSAASLRAALEAAGFAVTRAETIPGPFPIGYIEATPR